ERRTRSSAEGDAKSIDKSGERRTRSSAEGDAKSIDKSGQQPVGNVEVVFRNLTGEETAMAGADGRYRIDVPAGVYRAFVRDDSVLSFGRVGRVRVPGLPSLDSAGVPDENLMPLVAAGHDTDGVDLAVVRGGTVTGKVVDSAGRPVQHAALRALGVDGIKPTLGTDVAETDETGAYELRLPSGPYVLEATHPRYAGLTEPAEIGVTAGGHTTADLTLTAGCVIAGRVVAASGSAAGDGAIEKQWGETDSEFRPDGKIAADGTFRWVTTAAGDVTLRAWPWKSPPSQSRTFACRDGARFDNIVFALPANNPDIEGVLADATGAPVPLAFIDLAPLDPGGLAQQERTDADGKWGVFHMPAGRYQVTAYAPNRGVVSTIVTAPAANVRLALGGTGKIAGTTTKDFANGSFEIQLVACDGGIAIADDHRLVTVIDGHFELDDVPACGLTVAASVARRKQVTRVAVPAGGVGKLQLDLGAPRARHITGIVTDASGRPVEGAFVNAVFASDPDEEIGTEASATTDAAGHYAIDTFDGAQLMVYGQGRVANATATRDQMDFKLEGEPQQDEIEIPDHFEPDVGPDE
ncbi:MAG: carboxypeptidase-like regulatory domain-containing protein, partial [Kofleriaceae bacterium]